MAKRPQLTHLDARGAARMVEVGAKAETARVAVAAARVRLSREAFEQLTTGRAKKGDVLAVARVAGIQAAKKTSELIPLCHAIPLTSVEIDFGLDRDAHRVDVTATARCVGRTGVEMEALVAVSTAALTIYDMLKAVDRAIEIERVRLLKKSGGKSGEWSAT